MRRTERVLPLPREVRTLWKAQQALAKRYAGTRLKFTLDGRLVGDIAEALALEWFHLEPPKKRKGGVDAMTASGRTVQVKATGKERSGPAFTPGAGRADHLLFFRLDFSRNTAAIVYNGPEAPVRALLSQTGWTGTKVIAQAQILRLAASVRPSQAIPLRSARRDLRHRASGATSRRQT